MKAWLLPALIGGSIVALTSPASATTKQECADAYVEAQRSRKDGSLLSAQEQLDYFRKSKDGDTELAAKFRRLSKAAPTVDELRPKPT